MAIDPRLAALFETFYEEAAEGLIVAERALLDLNPGNEDSELVNQLFRSIHSIKGGGGTFGFTQLGKLSHVMETLLDQVREGERHLVAKSQDLLLESVDCLRCILIAHRENEAVDIERCERLSAMIQEILDGKMQAASVSAVASSAPSSVLSSALSSADISNRDNSEVLEESTSAATETSPGWNVRFRPFRHFMASGNDPYRLIRLLAELGPITTRCETTELPPLEAFEPEDCYLAWNIDLWAVVSKEEVADIFSWVDGDDCEVVIKALEDDDGNHGELLGDASEKNVDVDAPSSSLAEQVVKVAKTDPPAPAKKTRSTQMTSGSIRVSIDKIDSLVNLVGELVITQSMLDQIERDHELQHVQELRDGLAELERNTRELQETVMRIRMLPIGTTFARFPRLVHDLGRKLGKHIDLQLSGEATELDKTVLENIGDPLVHLIRNSVDHGIETPEVRVAAGKDPMGTVLLSASHQGGYVVIEVQDDGAGVNREKLLAKAREKGLLEQDAELSDEQVLNILFHPGLSTADEVSDVSGRGVGMDVVKRNIEALGGNITVTSEEGRGSSFTIRIPLTLAIIDGQLIRVGDETYIIPLVSIIESMQAENRLITQVAGRAEVYRFREEALPLVRVSSVFCVPPSIRERDGMIVVVEGDARKVALVVDELMGIQQVVIKSLDANYERVPGLSGATILGDGTVALILDMTGLIRLAHRGGKRQNSPRLAALDVPVETHAALH